MIANAESMTQTSAKESPMNPSLHLLERFPAAALAAAMVIAGTIGAFVVEAALDPVTTVFWRCCFASLFLLVWCVVRGHLKVAKLSFRLLLRSALGGVCIVLNWVAFFAALKMTSIATTTIVYHVQPFFVVLLGVWLFGERIKLDQILWMLGAFVGVVLASGLVGDPLATGVESIAAKSTWTLGIVLALIAAMLYAASTLIAKGLGGQRPEVTALSQTAVGVVLLIGFANFSGPVSAASWGWLVGIGVLHTGVSYVLMYAAYPRLTTPVIGILAFIYPLVAMAVDWAFYDHPIGVMQAVGMVLIAVGALGVKLGWRHPAHLFRRPENGPGARQRPNGNCETN